MMRPTPLHIKALAQSVRSFPNMLYFFEEWYAQELDQLPQAIINPALSQGRCQVLRELTKLLKESPELAASLDRPPSPTHTG